MDQNKKKVTPLEMEERLIEFGSRIIDMVEELPKSAAAKHLAGRFCAQERLLH